MEKKRRWIVGQHACLETLKVAPEQVRELFVLNMANIQGGDWDHLLKKVKVRPQIKGAPFFKELSEVHQGVAIGTDYWPSPKKGGDTSRIVFLDGIEDPHNLGAILRTCWLMNVSVVYVTERRSVKLTPTVHKVASGGCEHVAVEEANFQVLIKQLKEEGYWAYSFTDKTDSTIYENKFSPKVIFVFGNEEKGVRTPVERECDGLLKIPQVQEGPSYNVSVSVGIALAELNRQIGWE